MTGLVGALVGALNGALVGSLVGSLVGALVGELVGALVGALVGTPILAEPLGSEAPGANWLKSGPVSEKKPGGDIAVAIGESGEGVEVEVVVVTCKGFPKVSAPGEAVESGRTGGVPDIVNPFGSGGRLTPAGRGGIGNWVGGKEKLSIPD